VVARPRFTATVPASRPGRRWWPGDLGRRSRPSGTGRSCRSARPSRCGDQRCRAEGARAGRVMAIPRGCPSQPVAWTTSYPFVKTAWPTRMGRSYRANGWLRVALSSACDCRLCPPVGAG
jgi:hypothetical protein